MKREEIKSALEKESISLALPVNKLDKARAKEIRVVKEDKIDLKIREEIDLDKVAEANRIVVANKTVVEEISNLSNAFKRQNLLQRKSRIRSSKHWRDFRATSLEGKPNPDVISVQRETEMSKWREKNPKYSRLQSLFQQMTLPRFWMSL